MLQGVLGRVAVGGDNNGHAFARVVHLAAGQRPMVGDLDVLRHGPAGRYADHPLVGQVLACKDGDDARLLRRGRGVYVRDPGVRVRAAQEGQVEHARQPDIVREVSVPRQERRVLLAGDAVPHVPLDSLRHAATSSVIVSSSWLRASAGIRVFIPLLQFQEILSSVDGIFVLDEEPGDSAILLGLDLVEGFHHLDQADGVAGGDLVSFFSVKFALGVGAPVEGTGHLGFHGLRQLELSSR